MTMNIPNRGGAVSVLAAGLLFAGSGGGSVKRKYAEGDRGSYENEFKITTP
jgi:hypothetical protein